MHCVYTEVSDGCRTTILRFQKTIQILEFAEVRKLGLKMSKTGTFLHDNSWGNSQIENPLHNYFALLRDL